MNIFSNTVLQGNLQSVSINFTIKVKFWFYLNGFIEEEFRYLQIQITRPEIVTQYARYILTALLLD